MSERSKFGAYHSFDGAGERYELKPESMTPADLTALEAELRELDMRIVSSVALKAADAIAELQRKLDEARGAAAFQESNWLQERDLKIEERNRFEKIESSPRAELEAVKASRQHQAQLRHAAESELARLKDRVAGLEDILRRAKAFHDRDSGCNGFTADYELLRLEIDAILTTQENPCVAKDKAREGGE